MRWENLYTNQYLNPKLQDGVEERVRAIDARRLAAEAKVEELNLTINRAEFDHAELSRTVEELRRELQVPLPNFLLPTPHILHPTPYTLHPTPHTLHPTPYTPHPTPHTPHPTPYTLNPTNPNRRSRPAA